MLYLNFRLNPIRLEQCALSDKRHKVPSNFLLTKIVFDFQDVFSCGGLEWLVYNVLPSGNRNTMDAPPDMPCLPSAICDCKVSGQFYLVEVLSPGADRSSRS
jgi:hypothetical protein